MTCSPVQVHGKCDGLVVLVLSTILLISTVLLVSTVVLISTKLLVSTVALALALALAAALIILLIETYGKKHVNYFMVLLRLLGLTLVLALLDSIVLYLATVVGVLHAGLDLTVGEGTCETGEQLLGFLMTLGLACVET